MTNVDPSYKILDWDTDLFGYTVASINGVQNSTELAHTLRRMKKSEIRLAYYFLDPNDATANEDANTTNGKLVDTKITYRKVLNDLVIGTVAPEIQPYQESIPNSSLFSLSLQSGIYSRFFTDPSFKHGEYAELYSAWITKSVEKKIAFEVFTYSLETGEKIGLITLGAVDNIGSIGLLCVDERYRGNAIGSALIKSAEHIFYGKQIMDVRVSTQQRNLVACRFYEKHGFVVMSKQNVYHYWL